MLNEEGKRLKRFYEAELATSDVLRRTLSDDEAVVEGDLWSGARVNWDRARTMTDLNLVRQTIRTVTGLAFDQAGEAMIMPATSGEDEDRARADATIKSHILRHHERACAARFHIRNAISQAAACGISWLHDMNYDFGGRAGGGSMFRVEKSHEDWRYIVWDTSFRKPDFSDGRYLFHHRFIDLDAAKKFYPNHANILDSAATSYHAYRDIYGPQGNPFSDQFYGGPGGGEIWARDPVSESPFGNGMSGFGGTGAGGGRRDGVWVVRAWWRDFSREQGEIREKVFYRDFVVAGARGAWHSLMDKGEWHFIPFTPMIFSCDPSTGWPRGLAFDMKEVCRQFNLTISQMIDSAQSKSLQAEISAVAPMFGDRPEMSGDEKVSRLQSQLAQKFAVLLFADGALGDNRFKLDHNTQEFKQGHDLATLLMGILQSGVSSVNAATLGNASQARSGYAIERQQSQGAASLSAFIENVNLACRISGEKMLSLIQFYGRPELFYQAEDYLQGNRVISVETVLHEGGWEPQSYSLDQLRAQYIIVPQPFEGPEGNRVLGVLQGAMEKLPEEAASMMIPLLIRLIPGFPQGRQFAEAIAVFLRKNGIPVPDEFLGQEALKAVQDADQQNAQTQQEDRQIGVESESAKIDKDRAAAELARAKAAAEQIAADAKMMGVEVDAFSAGEKAMIDAHAAAAPGAAAAQGDQRDAVIAMLRQQLQMANARLAAKQGARPPDRVGNPGGP